MKKLALLLALPTLSFASHSIEMGTFYSKHKETGYSYNLAGVQINYEIGNTQGLKVIGKTRISNHKNLMFVQSESELLYYVPVKDVQLVPFFGVHTSHHNVYDDGRAVGFLSRSYMPVGVGVIWEKNNFIWNARGAHLHPLSNTFTELVEKEFRGKKYNLHGAFFGELKFGYQITPAIGCNILGHWMQDYRQNLKRWTSEVAMNFKF